MMTYVKTLEDAVLNTSHAKTCIKQNRGYDKAMAREGYEVCVSDELVPALTNCVERACEDLEPKDIERLSLLVLRFVRDKTA